MAAEIMKNAYGSIKIYTRHVLTCKTKGDKCRCPRWVYVRDAIAGTKIRHSLNVCSSIEAYEIASKIFRNLDPEEKIKAAAKETAQRNRKTVEEAIELFLARTEREYGRQETWSQYRSLLGWRDDKGVTRGRLLRYIEAYNLEYADIPIRLISDITPLWLQAFYSSWSSDYNNTTMRMRWMVVKTFFNFLVDMELLTKSPAAKIKSVSDDGLYRNAPLEPEQYNKIATAAKGDRRLFTFLEMMRWTGADLEDAIGFDPTMIDGDGVFRYRRKKTGVEAVIPLEPHVLSLLKVIPLGADSIADQPFRRVGASMAADHSYWYQQLKKLFKRAGVTEVKLQQLVKEASPKMLRHTFAVHYIIMGMDIPTIARMLGHSKTSTTERHYLPWVKQRDEAHVRRVREAQAQAAKNELRMVAEGGKRIAVQ